MNADSTSVMQTIDMSTENTAALSGLICMCGSKTSFLMEQRAFRPIIDPPGVQLYL